MTSPVDIANQALSAIGTRSTIESFAESSPEALAVNQWYDNVRTTALRTAQWGFARSFINLALLKSAPGTLTNPNPADVTTWDPRFPPPPWLFEYAYPDKCLMARYVVPMANQQLSGIPIFSTSTPTPWPAMGCPVKSIVVVDQDLVTGADFRAICTNQPQATLCYTRDILDPNVWDTNFQSVVISALAGSMALALTGDKNLKRILMQEANATIVQARVASANEGLPTQDTIPDWIRVRGISYGWDGFMQTLDNYGPLFPVPA